MRGPIHVPSRPQLGLVVAVAMLASAAPAAATGEGRDPQELPSCAEEQVRTERDGRVLRPWAVDLDEDGAVTGYSLVLGIGDQEMPLHLGRRAFSADLGPGRVLLGERDDEGTSLHLLDTRRGCRLWSRTLGRQLYLERGTPGNARLRFDAVDRGTRSFRGRLLLDPETGDSEGLIDGECIETCVPHDGDVSLAALAAPGPAQPVPSFAAGGWPVDKRLTFRWRAGGVPPAWARPPMMDAATDATSTSKARSPRFVYRSDAANAISYGGTMPAYCGINGIACAGRAMPSTWGAWIRPHGTDYAWGTLRWCQKTSSSQGCFDIRRVLLHELGHIAGLTHPSSAGFTLAATETVMHAITPARPRTGASRHSFGRCDVATLQELYDTPDNRTPISSCNDVVTRLTLDASRTVVSSGGSVKLTAQLRVDGRAAYGKLANDYLNARSVKLKYRRAGSEEAWRTAWMKPTYAYGRYQLTIAPTATWEFKAVFPRPSDEGLRYSRSAIVRVKVKAS